MAESVVKKYGFFSVVIRMEYASDRLSLLEITTVPLFTSLDSWSLCLIRVYEPAEHNEKIVKTYETPFCRAFKLLSLDQNDI